MHDWATDLRRERPAQERQAWDAEAERYVQALGELVAALEKVAQCRAEVSRTGASLDERLIQSGAVLSRLPPSEGVEQALTRIDWLRAGCLDVQRRMAECAAAYPDLVARLRVQASVIQDVIATWRAAAGIRDR